MNNERYRNKNKLPLVEVRIGFRCSEEGCDWKLVAKNKQKPIELWEALPLFGKHNIEKHYGSINVHMIPITIMKKTTSSK